MVAVMGFLRKAEHDIWVDQGEQDYPLSVGRDRLGPLTTDQYGKKKNLDMEE